MNIKITILCLASTFSFIRTSDRILHLNGEGIWDFVESDSAGGLPGQVNSSPRLIFAPKAPTLQELSPAEKEVAREERFRKLVLKVTRQQHPGHAELHKKKPFFNRWLKK